MRAAAIRAVARLDRRDSSRCCRGSSRIRTGPCARRWPRRSGSVDAGRRDRAAAHDAAGPGQARRRAGDRGAGASSRRPASRNCSSPRSRRSDTAIRAAAARALGQLKPAAGAAALRDAFRAALGEPDSDVRSAALEALAEYRRGGGGRDAQGRARRQGLGAAAEGGGACCASSIPRHARPRRSARRRASPSRRTTRRSWSVPEVSPHAFIETAKGTIEIELTVLDAPQTVQNFIALARKGYFNGLQIHRVVPNFVVQDGDPRGDGSGGPGYSIRDELNDRPYLRGTVGMALSGPDTGGSQFFITHSPQPHLDAKYTVFGHVVNGMDVVDRIQQLDVIQRVRIWDGKELAEDPIGSWQLRSWELTARARVSACHIKQKRGLGAPVFGGRGTYRFLPPFFFPPLAAFFAIAFYPPLRVGFVREERSPYRSAAASRHAGGASIRRPSLRAGPHSRELRPKKSGVQVALTPPRPVAALSASCRPFSCRPLRSSSPCVPPWNSGCSAVTGDQVLQQVG